MTESDILLRIQELMDGTEWGSDTLDEIAWLLSSNGYLIHDLAGVAYKAGEEDSRPPGQAWHEYRLTTMPDGSVRGAWLTNDDDDDGYPDSDPQEIASFSCEFKGPQALQRARKWAGVSRIGVSGVKVTVWLDGRKLTDKDKP